MSTIDYKAEHKKSSHHRKQLEQSPLAGCFYCKKIYLPDEIYEWVDGDDTALCPKCGIDSVIPLMVGDPDNKKILKEMFEYWFNRGVSYKMKDGKMVGKEDWTGRFKPGGALKE